MIAQKFLAVMGSAIAIAPLFLLTNTALAAPKNSNSNGLNGHYVGVTGSPGSIVSDIFNINNILGFQQGSGFNQVIDSITNGSTNNSVMQGRFDLPNSPFSVRGSMFLGKDSRAIEPSITYDHPLNKNTNLFVGGGYTLVQGNGKSTPLGSENSPVVTAGIESSIIPNLVIYGNARLRMNNGVTSEESPIKLQFGAGYKF